MKRASQANPNQRLINARLQKAWSQQEMAELVGTTRINISRWERGFTNPTPYFRQRLCTLFQKGVEELGFLQAPGEHHPTRPTSAAKQSAASLPLWHPPYWRLPAQRNPFFTGQEETLTAIQQIFHASRNEALARTCIITGLGGMGKTQVALEYAFRYRHHYQAVLWARGDTYEMLTEDAAALVRILQIPEEEQRIRANDVRAVQYWLRDRSDWLLILDNLADPRVVQELHASAHHGHLLVTTPSRAIGLLGQHLHLFPMETDESALFLLHRSQLISPEASLADASERLCTLARRLAMLLGNLPLALDQAGSYIEETGCDLATYLHLYAEKKALLLNRRGVVTMGHDESVTTTIQRALDTIRQTSPAAIDLLKLCAYLHPEAIPEEIITSGARVLDPPLHLFATNSLAFNTALAELRCYSLVERDPLKRTLTLHPLLQEMVRERIGAEEKLHWIAQTVKAVGSVFPNEACSTSQASWRFLQQTQACRDLIKQTGMAFPEATQLLYQADRYLLACADEHSIADTR